MLVGLFVERPVDRAAAARDRGRGGRAVHRRVDARAEARAAARPRARLAGDEDRRRGGQARRGQRGAQPGADRLDRVGADDRPGAGHARRRARGGPADRDSRTRSTSCSSPTTRSPRRTTSRRSAWPPSRPLRSVPGVDGRRRACAPATGRAFGSHINVTGVPPNVSQVIKVEWQAGGPGTPAQLGNDGAFVDKDYAKAQHLHVGSPLSVETPTGRVAAPGAAAASPTRRRAARRTAT